MNWRVNRDSKDILPAIFLDSCMASFELRLFQASKFIWPKNLENLAERLFYGLFDVKSVENGVWLEKAFENSDF